MYFIQMIAMQYINNCLIYTLGSHPRSIDLSLFLSTSVNHQIYFFFNFIEVYLIYNVVLLSGVQQSESVIQIHISSHFTFFSHTGHYISGVLIRVSCAIQQVLIRYLSYICICQPQASNLSLPHLYSLMVIHLFYICIHMVIHLFSTSVPIFLF